MKGYRYNEAVIQERTGKSTAKFFADLIDFVKQHVTEKIITQDLNMLLPYEQFSRVRKVLKRETLMFLGMSKTGGRIKIFSKNIYQHIYFLAP